MSFLAIFAIMFLFKLSFLCTVNFALYVGGYKKGNENPEETGPSESPDSGAQHGAPGEHGQEAQPRRPGCPALHRRPHSPLRVPGRILEFFSAAAFQADFLSSIYFPIIMKYKKNQISLIKD